MSHDNLFGFIQGSDSPLQDGPIIRKESKQSYPTNQRKVPPTSQLPDESAYQILRDPMEPPSCKAAGREKNQPGCASSQAIVRAPYF